MEYNFKHDINNPKSTLPRNQKERKGVAGGRRLTASGWRAAMRQWLDGGQLQRERVWHVRGRERVAVRKREREGGRA